MPSLQIQENKEGGNEDATKLETESTPVSIPGPIVKYLNKAKDGLLSAWDLTKDYYAQAKSGKLNATTLYNNTRDGTLIAWNEAKGYYGKAKNWFSDIFNERKYKVRDENGDQFFEDKEAVDEYCKEKNGKIEDFGNGFLCNYANGDDMIQQRVEGYSPLWNTVKPVLCGLGGAAALIALSCLGGPRVVAAARSFFNVASNLNLISPSKILLGLKTIAEVVKFLTNSEIVKNLFAEEGLASSAAFCALLIEAAAMKFINRYVDWSKILTSVGGGNFKVGEKTYTSKNEAKIAINSLIEKLFNKFELTVKPAGKK